MIRVNPEELEVIASELDARSKDFIGVVIISGEELERQIRFVYEPETLLSTYVVPPIAIWLF